jgi:phage terminase large subunit-like protein
MQPETTIRRALTDEHLLGSSLAGDSWQAWRTLLIAATGEELTPGERQLFTTLTGRAREPLQRVEELVAVVGRRGGKSRALATLACYVAGLCDHRQNLAPGERGVVLCIAPNQRQAFICLNYATAAFEQSPILAQLIEGRTQHTLELTNRVTIEVRAASFRSLRGPTYLCVIADESAFWHDDSGSS